MAKSWLNRFSKTKTSKKESTGKPFYNEQDILNNIGKILWAIFPEEAEYIIFEGQLYDQHQGSTVTYERIDGSIYWNEEAPPYEYISEIFELLKKFRSSKLFSKEDFTHVKIRLSNEMKITTKFAYISEDDNWPGLYMRGVSDLKQGEIKQFYIPQEAWEERVANFGKSDIG